MGEREGFPRFLPLALDAEEVERERRGACCAAEARRAREEVVERDWEVLSPSWDERVDEAI